jgi:hypothetical protein
VDLPTRSPTRAYPGFPHELSPRVRGIGPYLPFKLLEPAMGLTHAVPPLVAIGLLLAYLAAFGVAVHKWALARDLT